MFVQNSSRMPANQPAPPELPSLAQMAESFMPMILIFGLKWLDLDYTNPLILWGFRSVFVASIGVYLFLHYYIYQKLVAQKAALSARNISYVRALGPTEMDYSQGGKPETHTMETKTVFDYDYEQLYASAKSGLIGFLVSGGIHLYGGYMPPLVLQSVMGLRRAAEAPLYKIYIGGEEAGSTKALSRPFKGVRRCLRRRVS